jgi:TRAP-type C4-dicarboxylate transport system permease small subunit
MSSNERTKFVHVLDKSLVAIAMIGFIGMLLATGSQVLFRYVLRISVPWTEELARVLFVLSMFLGFAIAIRKKEHIVISLLFEKLGLRSQAIVHIAFNAAILILLCFLARGTLFMIQTMWNTYMISLGIQRAYLYTGEFIAILFMMFYVILEILEDVRTLRFGEKEESTEIRP